MGKPSLNHECRNPRLNIPHGSAPPSQPDIDSVAPDRLSERFEPVTAAVCRGRDRHGRIAFAGSSIRKRGPVVAGATAGRSMKRWKLALWALAASVPLEIHAGGLGLVRDVTRGIGSVQHVGSAIRIAAR